MIKLNVDILRHGIYLLESIQEVIGDEWVKGDVVVGAYLGHYETLSNQEKIAFQHDLNHPRQLTISSFNESVDEPFYTSIEKAIEDLKTLIKEVEAGKEKYY